MPVDSTEAVTAVLSVGSNQKDGIIPFVDHYKSRLAIFNATYRVTCASLFKLHANLFFVVSIDYNPLQIPYIRRLL